MQGIGRKVVVGTAAEDSGFWIMSALEPKHIRPRSPKLRSLEIPLSKFPRNVETRKITTATCAVMVVGGLYN